LLKYRKNRGKRQEMPGIRPNFDGTTPVPDALLRRLDKQYKISVYFYRYKMMDIEFIWDHEKDN
jgi:hypothetical protein